MMEILLLWNLKRNRRRDKVEEVKRGGREKDEDD